MIVEFTLALLPFLVGMAVLAYSSKKAVEHTVSIAANLNISPFADRLGRRVSGNRHSGDLQLYHVICHWSRRHKRRRLLWLYPSADNSYHRTHRPNRRNVQGQKRRNRRNRRLRASSPNCSHLSTRKLHQLQ